MTTRPRYRNVAFLMELMINILVFSLSCAILVGLFGKAGQISRKTIDETSAKTEVRSLVEVLRVKGTDGLPHPGHSPWIEGEKAPHPFITSEHHYVLYFYYNDDWAQVTPEHEADYTFWVEMLVEDEPAEAGVLQHITATAYSQGDEAIYALDTAHYMPLF